LKKHAFVLTFDDDVLSVNILQLVPFDALIGNGVWVVMVPLFMAVVGAFCYGILREKLPH